MNKSFGFFRNPHGHFAPPEIALKLRGGFTLIELIVVIAISMILSGLIIAYSGASRSRAALSVEEEKVANYILMAKSLTITTKRTQITFPCGYGVRFDYSHNPGSYYLFSYSTSTPYSTQPQTPGQSGNPCDNIVSINYTGDAGYVEVASSTLPANVLFGTGGNEVGMVFFTPPLPTTQMWDVDGSALGGQGSIYMKTADGASAANVSVTSVGQVNFY